MPSVKFLLIIKGKFFLTALPQIATTYPIFSSGRKLHLFVSQTNKEHFQSQLIIL
jgi:hypothetical protein